MGILSAPPEAVLKMNGLVDLQKSDGVKHVSPTATPRLFMARGVKLVNPGGL